MKEIDLHPVFSGIIEDVFGTMAEITRPILEPTTPMKLSLETAIKTMYREDDDSPFIHQEIHFENDNIYDTIQDVYCWISTKYDISEYKISDIICKNINQDIIAFDSEKVKHFIEIALINKI
jgi:hypothetical protein